MVNNQISETITNPHSNKKQLTSTPYEIDELEEYETNADCSILNVSKLLPRYNTRSKKIHLINHVQPANYIMITLNLASEELAFHNSMMEEFNLPIIDPQPTKIHNLHEEYTNFTLQQINTVHDPMYQSHLEYFQIINTPAITT